MHLIVEMDKLEERISEYLPSLSEEHLQRVTNRLNELGVEGVEDLLLVREDDLKDVLNPIQGRKFMGKIKGEFNAQ